MKDLRNKLALIFHGDARKVKWGIYLNTFIVGLIVLSTIALYLSTFNLSIYSQKIIKVIDIVTVSIFTVEILLRIWTASVLGRNYHGLLGRVRYCLTFYGFIDIISTFSFYLTIFIPIPYPFLKSLRILRLLRAFRYMRSFNLLQQALCSKVKEMFIALQCLVVVTLILSFGLYFYEHAVQPDVYDNVWVSIVWAFSQYIGNPGNFIDTPPISNGGYIIACLIGVLKIALFAVPAGLVGSSFAVAMSNALHEKEIERNAEKLKLAFESKLDRPTGFQIVPQHRSFCEIQTRLGLKQDEIIDVVSYSDNFRLFNLAVTQPIEEHPQDKLIVSHFPKNRSYGCCINRNSKVTIVSPSSLVDPAIGHFSYYLALIGGFNYISREVGELCPYNSYFKFENRETHSEHLAEYMNDLEELTAGENTWTFTTLVASGANEPNYPTKIHFSAGGSMDDFTETGLIIEEIQSFKAFYDDLADVLINKFDFESDYQKYHDDSSPCLFSRKFKEGRGCKNNIIVRFAWSVCLWDMRRIELARTIAEILTKHFIQEQSNISYDETLINKVVGFKI